MKGVFLDVRSLSKDDVDFSVLRDVVDDWEFIPHCASNEIEKNTVDADIVISNKINLDRHLLNNARKLKLVCIAATGTNNVDLAAAHERNIRVCNVTSYATNSVVQHVFMLLLSLIRKQAQYSKAVYAGEWHNSREFCLLDHTITELTGRNLGIVGYGELGQAVASVARCFGMNVLVAERARQNRDVRPDRVAFTDVLKKSDIISLHCPLTDETRNLFGPHELSLMKPGSILINTARGGIVDEQALADNLRSGHIGAAGVDVLSEEPPVGGNPLLEPSVPNLLVTPHIAWSSQEARQRLVCEVALNIKAFLSGVERNIV